jgi:hypothetical protein
VSGRTTIEGGAKNGIGGGRGIPIFIFTAAIVMIGKTLTNADRIVPKSNFFILLPPLSFSDAIWVKKQLRLLIIFLKVGKR